MRPRQRARLRAIRHESVEREITEGGGADSAGDSAVVAALRRVAARAIGRSAIDRRATRKTRVDSGPRDDDIGRGRT